MPQVKLIWFALRQLSAMGYYHAGAEMFGGSERRARADVHRHLSNMTGSAIRDALRSTRPD